MARSAPGRTLAAALLVGSAVTPALAGPTTARWATPVSGNFYNPANWDDGIGPAVGADMIIDAAGQPYTVDWPTASGRPRVNSFLLDSHDVRVVMRGGLRVNDSDFRVAGDTVIRRGVLDLNGQIFGTGALRIEAGGTLDIQNGPSNDGFRGAQLALDVFNDGNFIVRGGATLTQIRTSGVFSTGIRIVNNESGTMRFEGGNLFTAGTLDNHGLIVIENDPQFNGAPPLDTDGASFGPLDFQPTSFNNHGTLRVEQGQFLLGGSGVHTGQFELLTPESVFVLAGDHAFMPGSRVIGPGTTRLSRFGSLEGTLSLDGNFEVESISSPINATLDIAGNLALIGAVTDIEFAGLLRANLITGDLRRSFQFLEAVDIAFDQTDNNDLGSAEFFGAATIRGDFSSLQSRSVFHQNANITGSVGNAAFMRDAYIGGNADNVDFSRGASIGGNLTGGATAVGRVNVNGDVIATSGAWSFQSDSDAFIPSMLAVAGDVTITRPFEIRGDIIAQGDFSAIQGRYSNITADTIAFGNSISSSAGSITLYGNSRVQTGGERTIIRRALIRSDFGDSPTGSETVTFVNGFEVVYTPITQFTRSGLSVVVNPDTHDATTFHFLADSILAGTLDVFVVGDASSLSFGDSFTILDGSHPFNPSDPVATVTGEFDRLFLPSLPGDLFFDVVYEPSAVRLVVVPAPGAATTLAGVGALAFTRRRRRAATALAATLAAVAGTTALAGPTTTNWAGPVSGYLFEPTNWENGLAPSETVGAIIDATGSPYTVHAQLLGTSLRSMLVDSEDARLTLVTLGGSVLDIIDGVHVRQGRFTFQGTMSGGSLLIGAGSTFDIPEYDLGNVYRGAVLAHNVFNEGVITLGGEAFISQSSDPYGPIPADISITNSAAGVMRLAGANILARTTLNNYGLIEVENNPDFEHPNGSVNFDGSALGYTSPFGGGNFLAVTNNHGVVRLHQRDLVIDGRGEHSGRFELLSPDAMLQFRGEHAFQPTMSITGPGLTHLYNPLTMSGSIRTEGDLELFTNLYGEVVTDLALDIEGDLILTLAGNPTFTDSVRAGRITGDIPDNLTFAGNADLVFDEHYRSAEFMGNATIRGDHLSTGGGSVFHQSAHIMGTVRRAEFLAEATIDADASLVVFAQGASVGGNLTGGAQGVGDITVGGDLIATTGSWLFYTPLGSASPTRLEVAGEVEITVPFTTQAPLIVGGAFDAVGGRFESVTADTIRFGSSDPAAAATTIIESGSIITSRNGQTLIENTLIRIDPDGGAFGAEELVFTSGFDLLASDSGGLAVLVNPSTESASTFIVNADSTLSGTLAVGVFGPSSLLAFGDSFTIVEGRIAPGAAGLLPLLAGEFDRLSLSYLPNGLSFDVVYEPSAVRLVVVPAPGAATTLAGVGALAFTRRRRRTTAALAATLAAVAGTTALAGPTTTTNWAAPVSGDFFDSANWENGLLPSDAVSAIIGAAGSPYTVTLLTNRASLAIPITIDSDDATLRYSTDFTNFTSPTQSGSIHVLRGALVIAESTEMRNLDPINVAATGRIRFDGSLTQPVQQRLIRFGRDLNLEGDAAFAGRATLTMYDDTFFSGFPVPRFSIADSGNAEFAGGNIIAGGIITNNGAMRFINDPVYDEDDFFFELSGSRIGFESDNNLGFTTTFLNNGTVTVDQGDLILGAFGSHSGEFHLASGSRLVLEENQHFTPQSRVTGNGIILAEAAERITGALSTQGDLHLERGGLLSATLNIGGDLQLLSISTYNDVDFTGPVEVAGSLNGRGGSLIFRSGFTGAVDAPESVGGEQHTRSIEVFGAADIRGDLATNELSTFHGVATVSGNVSRALFNSTALIQGNATGASFKQSAFIGGHATGVGLEDGGAIGGNLSGTVTIQGTTTVGGDFTQTSATRSTLTRRFSGERLIVSGDVDVRSIFFESSMPIVAGGDFRTIAGLFSSITAATVTFGGIGATGIGVVNLYRSSSIASESGPALIQRARVSVYQDYDGATGTISFLNGFEVIYVPITISTRSGFNARINLETDRHDIFAFFGDSLLAGTLDIGVIGDISLLSFGDSFTILEGRSPSGSTDPLPTITGEFDRLFLPTLPGDLFFDLVYEPSAVRLVVVPAPGPVSLLALAGLAATRRRRSRVIAAAAIASCAGFAHAGVTPVNSWLGASDGNWFDASRWSLGAPPPTALDADFPDLVFNATGATYTVTNDPAPLLGFVNNVLVDSPDITLILTSRLAVLGRFDLTRGMLQLRGELDTEDGVHIGAAGVFRNSTTGNATIWGDLVNDGLIELSGSRSIFITSRGFGLDSVLQNNGAITVSGDSFGGSGIRVDHLINDGTIELNANGQSYGQAFRSVDRLTNTGEIVARGGLLGFGEESVHTGVVRLLDNAVLQLDDNTTTFLPTARVEGGLTFIGSPNAFRDTVLQGILRTDDGVVIHDRAKVRGWIEAQGNVDIVGHDIEVDGGVSTPAQIFVNESSVAFGGSLLAGSMQIFDSDLDIAGPALVDGATLISASTVALRDRSSRLGSLELVSSHLTLGDNTPSNGVVLSVQGDVEARGSSTLLTYLSGVRVDGDFEWTGSNGSLIATALNITGDAFIRSAEIAGALQADRVTLEGQILGSLDITARDAPVLMRAGVFFNGGRNHYGISNIRGDIVLGIGAFTGYQIDLLASGPDSVVADELRVEGHAHIDSIFGIRFVGDVESRLALGDSFTILTADLITGEFLQFSQPALADGLFFDLVYEPSAVRLVVVPSPGAIAAFAGLGALTLARRRRTSR
jgi:hypothetical protein